jgi:hypothetical protein
MANSSGIPKRGMRDYTINSDGVNEQSFDVDGDFVHVQSISVAGVTVSLRFDDGPAVVRSQGQGNRVYYSRVTVLASAAATVTLQLGYGYATDARAEVNANITTEITPALHTPAQPRVTVLHGGAATLLLAADVHSQGCYLGVASSETVGVWIGDNAVAANNGLFLEPGQIIPWPSQAAVYAANSDPAVDTHVTVVKFSAV